MLQQHQLEQAAAQQLNHMIIEHLTKLGLGKSAQILKVQHSLL